MAPKALSHKEDHPHPADHIYTPNYCEENIYWLAKQFQQRDPSLNGIYVVFISNHFEQIPIWCQRSSSHPEGLVVWDYHVILLALNGAAASLQEPSPQHGQVAHIYDLDTTLPFPCPAPIYQANSLKGGTKELYSSFWRLFRVISASAYLSTFASDRSHMLKRRTTTAPAGVEEENDRNISDKLSIALDKTGSSAGPAQEYLSPPPEYPCIVNAHGETNTLPKYRAMPPHTQAASSWEETELVSEVAGGDAGGSDSDGNDGQEDPLRLPYGVVLTQEGFEDFCRRAKTWSDG